MKHILTMVASLVLVGGVAGVGATPAAPKPDLRCAELSVEKVPTMEVPLRVRVHLWVKNFGPGSSESYVAHLSHRKGSSGAWSLDHEYPLPFSPPNGGAVWNPTIDLPEGGTYTFKVEVDVTKKVTETNEGNNIRTVTKTFAAGTPDLTVTDLVARVTRKTVSGTVHVQVDWDVANIGDGKAAGSFVTVLKVAKNGSPFVELARFTRSNLQPKAKLHISKTQSFTEVTRLKFRVETDATHVLTERSNANNSVDSDLLQP